LSGRESLSSGKSPISGGAKPAETETSLAEENGPAVGPVVQQLEQDAREFRWTVSITGALMLAFGSLLVLGIATVLGLGLYAAAQNSFTLLRDRANVAINFMEIEISSHMVPAEKVAQQVARLFEQRKVRLESAEDMQATMLGGISGVEQLRGLLFMNRQGLAIGASRTEDGRLSLIRFDMSQDTMVRMALRSAGPQMTAAWLAPSWRPNIRQTVLVYRVPVRVDGKIVGVVAASISIEGLSRFVAKLGGEAENITPFILLGRDRVLAHKNMVNGFTMSAARPLPTLRGFTDPVVVRLWDTRHQKQPWVKPRPPLRSHILNFAGQDYVVFYKPTKGYGAPSWTVGAYMPEDVFAPIFRRLIGSFIAGAAALVIAVVAAIFIGRRLSRPVRRLSVVAGLIGSLKLDEARELPPSRIRELNEQSRTFNAVIGAMRWFSAYVPKTIVRHLLQSGDLSGLTSDRRSLTVMFTDVQGFSTFSEGADAAGIAAFLNDHVNLVTHCIDEEGGTVDKFIGDSVMAFWGAPEKQKNRAVRACRAALAIRRALRIDNASREAAGKPPIHMRIGLHSGQATVGNIGTADRVNYTIIGDMVNVGQRLEQLGKEVDVENPDAPILISADTVADLDASFRRRSVGAHRVRGREGPIEVFELLD